MKIVRHENKWPWGRTVTLVMPDGSGIIEMSFSDDNIGVCFLSGLSVVEEKRGRGIASSLMLFCEDYCKKNGIFRIDLNSVMTPFVLKFYHELGFKDIKESDGFMQMYKLLSR